MCSNLRANNKQDSRGPGLLFVLEKLNEQGFQHEMDLFTTNLQPQIYRIIKEKLIHLEFIEPC